MPRLLLQLLKWAGIAIGGLIGLIVIAVVVVYFVAGARLNKTYDIEVAPIAIPTDEAAIARGKHLVESALICQECHGENLQGDVMEDDPPFGRIVASNLTPGRGGVGGTYGDVDFVRALRHGVRPDGTPLVIMPAELFTKLGDSDMGAVIAYVKSLAPVDNELPSTTLAPLGRLFFVLDLFGGPLLPAEVIEHGAPRKPVPRPGVTAEYGEYLAFLCIACHGDELGGVESEEYGLAPNITSGGRSVSHKPSFGGVGEAVS